ncbi:pilus assembly protein PilP [Hylemonella gracilis]|uniref:pilus assembly protein PilP n=1 Tax=Hylemonella gracilis TaxID=80880 RepID=UPI0018CC6E6A|nr:pilus assembly protein PilP [Hylemonella gracilis]
MLALALVCAACERAEEPDLRDWLAEQRQPVDAGTASLAVPVPPSAVTTALTPLPLERPLGADPFDPRRLAGPSPRRTETGPDQPLEARPLSALRMVGSLRRGEEVVALVQADLQIYQVPVGALLGTGRAQVLRISEDGITLRLASPGSQGEAGARTLTLPLQGR